MIETAKKFLQNCIGSNEVPFLEELELLLGVHRDTIHQWRKKEETDADPQKAEFAFVCDQITSLQKLRLQRLSISKERFSPGQVFLMKVNHNMREVIGVDPDPDEKGVQALVIYAPKRDGMETPPETGDSAPK